MKKLLPLLFLLPLFASSEGPTQNQSHAVVDAIRASYSPRHFVEGPIAQNLIEEIVACGVKAPSARNSQPWHFTVVADQDLVLRTMPNMPEGNVLIVVSGPTGGGRALQVAFDCALATQNMFLAALDLGLGARIYASPLARINDGMKDVLNIPDGYEAITVLRVGHLDETVDGLSGASGRKTVEEVVTYLY